MTYVYCVVSAARAPRVARIPRGLPGLGPARALAIDRTLFAIVATASESAFNQDAIEEGLRDLDWVSRMAVAHEAIVEHFLGASAVLPMKLFTIFTDDDRTVAYLRAKRRRLAAVVKRVTGHREFGLRVRLDGPVRRSRTLNRAPASGSAYLAGKLERLNEANDAARGARTIATRVYRDLSRAARVAKRRTKTEAARAGGSVVLDAAFLVSHARSAAFRSAAKKHARELAPLGYALTLTGPWPPYTFVQG